jgi:DNA repair exonuclease SbcCD ATPase subunit
MSNNNNNSYPLLSSSSSSRKRTFAATAASTSLVSTTMVEMDGGEPPVHRARKDVLSVEVETLQAELEHERSLRALDAKRFLHTQQRLQKQLEFSVEETKEAKALMEEMRQEHDKHIEQLKRARSRLQQELREAQQAWEAERVLATANSAARPEDPRIESLKLEVQAQSTENESLKETIVDLQNELKRWMDREASTFKREEENVVPYSTGAISEVRPEVLKELNRVRILLAESERKNRQIKRAVEEAALKSKQLIHEKERVRSTTIRIEQLEAELKEETKTGETAVAELQKLKEEHETVLEKFGKLRDAVYAERAKAEKASERADQAEALAGKGSFDPVKSRVLHISSNPLTEALKEEINVLRRQVEALSGKAKKAAVTDVDPNKLHQRLKESFKEQIGRFREGVYLMTGFKVIIVFSIIIDFAWFSQIFSAPFISFMNW